MLKPLEEADGAAAGGDESRVEGPTASTPILAKVSAQFADSEYSEGNLLILAYPVYPSRIRNLFLRIDRILILHFRMDWIRILIRLFALKNYY